MSWTTRQIALIISRDLEKKTAIHIAIQLYIYLKHSRYLMEFTISKLWKLFSVWQQQSQRAF